MQQYKFFQVTKNNEPYYFGNNLDDVLSQVYNYSELNKIDMNILQLVGVTSDKDGNIFRLNSYRMNAFAN